MRMVILGAALALALAGSAVAHVEAGVSLAGGALCAEVHGAADACVDGLHDAAAAGCEVSTEPLGAGCEHGL